MTDNYRDGLEYLSAQFPEVNGCDFYRDIFPNNENKGEERNDYSRPNAIFLFRLDNEKERRLRQRIMLNDMWEDDYRDYVEENTMTLCSGVAYRGKKNTLANARQMNALIIDLDGAGGIEISRLFKYFSRAYDEPYAMPLPTYLVLSGGGVHVYYVFENPIALFPNIKAQMKKLKEALINCIWLYESTSQIENRQYQGITQGFRMVGSVNDKYGTEIKAFRVGQRVTLEYLNQYIREEENRVDVKVQFKPSTVTKEKAAQLYPEWYQHRIIEGNKEPRKWNVKRDLYEWWKRQLHNKEIVGGRRYNYMMCMAAYAYKCDVPKKELKSDMQVVFEYLRTIEHVNELTQDDVKAALQAYDKKYYNMKISEIEKRTGMRIERNKRNGRKQEVHLQLARYVRDEINGKKETWREGNGRPSAAAAVAEYREQHTEARKVDCIRDTGLSKKTVYKWWNGGEQTV